ncbi:uncharacterized protein ACA1_245490 [Acanthamoeba castellanii str. Neff]|uniref:Uncharacterized protein n=1 Tax=Acanthamoeba castellanii (strain ATCC 30010 / Neff) TaxID=1257118 RepID=L8GK92_ACACF|nr:uncharacterized protein ACA1_245490 [Acanthamoeba castellanii str. Neff]ELR13457.1 hypothetical protein ACA1_245490 [Acanthamoeba castellanii str. Neff]
MRWRNCRAGFYLGSAETRHQILRGAPAPLHLQHPDPTTPHSHPTLWPTSRTPRFSRRTRTFALTPPVTTGSSSATRTTRPSRLMARARVALLRVSRTSRRTRCSTASSRCPSWPTMRPRGPSSSWSRGRARRPPSSGGVR